MNTKVLESNALFQDVKREDLESMLTCLNAAEKSYKKGNFILLKGDSVTNIGIVIKGMVHVLQEDRGGTQVIIANLEQGDIFAETFVCAKLSHIPVSVLSVTDTVILWINYTRILTTCSSTCVFHTKLIENMLKLVASKNLILNQKMEILSKRTIREKLLLYLQIQQGQEGNNPFTIPFSRSGLADYLCIDRSAMSRELCKMREEGLLTFQKNIFTI